MVKVTLLSEEKDDYYHTTLAFYDFASNTFKENEVDKFIFLKSYELETKKFNTHTTTFTSEQLKKLKEALEAI
jgi:hypothetical protein